MSTEPAKGPQSLESIFARAGQGRLVIAGFVGAGSNLATPLQPGQSWDAGTQSYVSPAAQPNPPLGPAQPTSQPGIFLPTTQSLFILDEKMHKAEPVVVTLTPPIAATSSSPLGNQQYNEYEMNPALGGYLIIKWGNQQQPAQMEVDFAQGTVIPIYTAFISAVAANENPLVGLQNVGAFLAPGQYSAFAGRRTKAGYLGNTGQLITPTTPMLAGVGVSAPVAVAPYSQFLSMNCVGAIPGLQYVVSFLNSASLVVGGAVVTASINSPQIPIPSDAKFAIVQNVGTVPITCVRFVFILGGLS